MVSGLKLTKIRFDLNITKHFHVISLSRYFNKLTGVFTEYAIRRLSINENYLSWFIYWFIHFLFFFGCHVWVKYAGYVWCSFKCSQNLIVFDTEIKFDQRKSRLFKSIQNYIQHSIQNNCKKGNVMIIPLFNIFILTFLNSFQTLHFEKFYEKNWLHI